jgi:hypothetical protein
MWDGRDANHPTLSTYMGDGVGCNSHRRALRLASPRAEMSAHVARGERGEDEQGRNDLDEPS